MGMIILFFLLINSAFSSSGFNGVIELFEYIFEIVFGLFKLINVFNLFATGDSILTELFAGYFIYLCVGCLFELFNINKDNFGKLFGKAVYWIIGFPVSALLNWISALIF